jgi:hypothetical protein
MSGKRWSRRSTYNLSRELKDFLITASPSSVGTILKAGNFRLRANRKSVAETKHPDRNSQFEIIAKTRKEFEEREQPIISIDSKKKELIGNFKNPGRTWRKKADEVLDHDFRSQASGLATPYGIYEPVYNRGTVIVGMSSDTAEFAVDCIEMWLTKYTQTATRPTKELLILCDCGGSNGSRVRLWKQELYQKICQKYDLVVHVCHYPAGASKWNPIEHRLFSAISSNWQGRPLRSFEIALELIRATTNKKGLTVEGYLNEKGYQTGKKVTDREMGKIKIVRHAELPQWNYSLLPMN